MKKLTLVTLVIVSLGCAKAPEVKSKELRAWSMASDYATCEANPTPEARELKLDFTFTLNRTDLPFGRYDALRSTRLNLFLNGEAYDIGSSLITRLGEENNSGGTWSRDGKTIFINHIWQDPELGMREEYEERVIMDAQKTSANIFAFNVETLEYKNLTSDNPASFWQVGTQELSSGELLFSAFVDNEMSAFTMQADGSQKTKLKKTKGYAYGMTASPDETRYAFHAITNNYQLYIGEFASGVEKHIQTPCAFNFAPAWSPDSKYVVFWCGPNAANAQLAVAHAQSGHVKVLASRGSYSGSVPYFDGYDFHGGGSDRIAWSSDSKSIIFAANYGASVELYSVDIHSGHVKALTAFGRSSSHFPAVTTKHGEDYVIFTHDRNLYALNLNKNETIKLTNLVDNCIARYPNARPTKGD